MKGNPMILKSSGNAEFDSAAIKFGQGLFETMLFKENRIVFLKQHIKRLFHSSEILDIGQNHIAALIDDILSLKASPVSDCIIRMSLYDCGYSIETRKIVYDEDSYRRGFRLCSYPYRRGESPLFRHKTTSYLSNIYAKKYAKEREFDDSLIYGSSGKILECSYSNIFCRKGNDFFFVDEKNSFLEGIASQNIAAVLKSLGFNIVKKDITIDFLKSADNIFISNSAMNMMSVGIVDESIFKKDVDICFKVNKLLIEMDRKSNGENKSHNERSPLLISSENAENQEEMNIDILMDFIKGRYRIDNRFLLIFLTGSSRNILFEKQKDIDIFVIDEISDIQIRDMVTLNGYELDINILSRNLVDRLIDQNETFMIKALRNSTYVEGSFDIFHEYKMKICQSTDNKGV